MMHRAFLGWSNHVPVFHQPSNFVESETRAFSGDLGDNRCGPRKLVAN